MGETPKLKTPLITYEECKESFFSCKSIMIDTILIYRDRLMNVVLSKRISLKDYALASTIEIITTIASDYLILTSNLSSIRLVLIRIDRALNLLKHYVEDSELKALFEEFQQWCIKQRKALEEKEDYP